MKKILYSICAITVVFVFSSCETDMLKEVNEGEWNNERNILALTLEEQIGLSEIVRTENEATVNVTINAGAVDMASVNIAEMVLSYDASANVGLGDKMNFDNAENTSSITVTSKKGVSLEWTVIVEPFINHLEGVWTISSYYFKWDDGFGWGNAGEAELADLLPGTAAGLDDIVTFGPVEGTNIDGLVYGNYERTTGDNGQGPSFVYEKTSVDYAVRFNQLPVGTGEWVLNKDNTVTINVGSNSFTTKNFEVIDESTLKLPLDPGEQDLGKINWDDYYGDHTNKFAASSELYYTFSKQ